MQVLVGLASVFSVFMLYYVCYGLGENWVRDFDNSSQGIRWAAAVAVVFLRTAGAMLLPTFCMGLAFPLAVRAVVAEGGSPGRDVGRLYALNTVGAIIGAFLAGFVLLPVLGIAWTIIFLGAAQMTAGALVYWFAGDATPAQRWAVAGVSIAAIAVAAVRLPADARFHRDTRLERVVFYKEGPLATVSVAQNTLGHRTIYVDNVGVAGTDPMLLTDQKSLAHVPMVLLRQPKSALTVGFGSGGASYSYTLYPELERIHCVEITRTVIEASPWLVDSHKNVVMHRDAYRAQTGREPEGLPLWDDGGASGWFKSDPRYRIILDDARSYLRFTGTKYDIIATDCTDLRYKSNANLYDLEYFEICRDHITEDGMVVVWMPLAGLSPEAMRVAVRTFQRVFPNTEVFYMNNEPTHYILLLGTREPLKVDAALMAERMARPEVAADLREIHLEQPEKMLSCFVTGREALAGLLKGDILNTPDNPYLEFESPRYGYGDAPLLDNLDALFSVREDPARLVAAGTARPEVMESLKKYYEAAPWIIRGHRHYREMELVQACEAYMQARTINPSDRSVHYLLGFEELRRRVRGQPLDAWGRFHLAHLMAMQQRDSEAVTLFNDFLRVAAAPESTGADADMVRRAREELANIYERNGQPDRAEQQRRLAAQVKP
jgi:spermidine synthase